MGNCVLLFLSFLYVQHCHNTTQQPSLVQDLSSHTHTLILFSLFSSADRFSVSAMLVLPVFCYLHIHNIYIYTVCVVHYTLFYIQAIFQYNNTSTLLMSLMDCDGIPALGSITAQMLSISKGLVNRLDRVLYVCYKFVCIAKMILQQ